MQYKDLKNQLKELEKLRKKKTERLVDLVIKETDSELFSDQFQEGFIAVKNENQQKIWKLRSRLFKKWLAYQAWKKYEEGVSSDIIQSVVNILEGKALYAKDSKQHQLHIRLALYDNAIWYDLGNAKAVRVTKDGWNVIYNPPILFRRLPHQKVQVEPSKNGDILKLLNFVNLPKKDEQLLFLDSLVGMFIPGYPHPIIVFHGPQGAGKTTNAKVSKDLVDPSAIEVLSPPDDLREYVQMASHHWLISLDNVNRLSNTLSDALCRTVTGSGFSKRELYSDDEDIIYSFQHTLSINGVNLVVEQGDLLDRCIILELQRLKYFRDEKKFWKEFNRIKPELLGAIFNTVSLALKNIDDIPPCEDMRMQDFARWGCAISRALGYTDEDFLQAYKRNIELQHEEAIDASPVGQAVMKFMEDKVEWSGTPTQILRELTDIAMTKLDDLSIDVKSRSWPKDARWLWRKLKLVLSNLEAVGIKSWRDRGGDKREIHFEKVEKSEEKKNDVNDVLLSS